MRPSTTARAAKKSVRPPRPAPVAVPRPAAPAVFIPNAAQRRLLDIIHGRPSHFHMVDLCNHAGIPRRTYYSWCQNPAFRLWLATAWSARLLLDGSVLLNVARANSTTKYSYWKALFDLTFDPKGLGYLQKWQQAVASGDNSLFDPGPGNPIKPDPPALPPEPEPDPNEDPMIFVRKQIKDAMLASASVLSNPLYMGDPLDPDRGGNAMNMPTPPAIPVQSAPEQNQSHSDSFRSDAPLPNRVAKHIHRCLHRPGRSALRSTRRETRRAARRPTLSHPPNAPRPTRLTASPSPVRRFESTPAFAVTLEHARRLRLRPRGLPAQSAAARSHPGARRRSA